MKCDREQRKKRDILPKPASAVPDKIKEAVILQTASFYFGERDVI